MKKEYQIIITCVLARTGETYETPLYNGGTTIFDDMPQSAVERIAKTAMENRHGIIGYKIISRDVSPWEEIRTEARQEMNGFIFTFQRENGMEDKTTIYELDEDAARRFFNAVYHCEKILSVQKIVKPL